MPGLPHEFLIDAFRNRPEMVVELVSRLGVDVPPHSDVATVDSDLSQVVPASLYADLILRMLRGRDAVGAMIVEVQLQVDHRKEMTWPVYLAVERSRSRVPTWLVVVAPDEKVAHWARQPIDCGSAIVQPVVIGPKEIPRVETPEEAVRSVELAVLSMLAHWKDDGAERMAHATAEAIERLGDTDEDRAKLYYEYLYFAIGSDLDRLLERAMNEGLQLSESAWAKRWIRQGEARGRAEGRAEGKAEGEAKALLRLLTKRFGPIAEETTAWILAATIEQLERGTDAILDARSIDDVLDAVGVR